MTTVPLTDDQSLRVRVMRFIGLHESQPLDVVTRFGQNGVITADNEAAYEAQLVTWGLLEAATLMPQPRYTITPAGYVYLGLAQENGQVLDVDGIKVAIPEGLFAGDDETIAAGIAVLIASNLIMPNTGWTLNGT